MVPPTEQVMKTVQKATPYAITLASIRQSMQSIVMRHEVYSGVDWPN